MDPYPRRSRSFTISAFLQVQFLAIPCKHPRLCFGHRHPCCSSNAGQKSFLAFGTMIGAQLVLNSTYNDLELPSPWFRLSILTSNLQVLSRNICERLAQTGAAFMAVNAQDSLAEGLRFEACMVFSIYGLAHWPLLSLRKQYSPRDLHNLRRCLAKAFVHARTKLFFPQASLYILVHAGETVRKRTLSISPLSQCGSPQGQRTCRSAM